VARTERSLRSSERVEPEAFSERVRSRIGDAALEVQVRFGQVIVSADPGRIVDVMSTLKGDPELQCDYFTFLSAADWQDKGFEVIATVFSTRFENTVVTKVRLPSESPTLASITGVYGGADWHERECAEMFGIHFEGHPNLVKLYLAEDFIGHPLRKDFQLASRTHKAWPGAKDPEEAAGGRRA
jgi:NADH-quinone oxidoreductase subunit C